MTRGTVSPAVIDLGQPQLQGLVEVPQAVAFEAGQELAAHGPEEALDFAATLGGVRLGVDEGNTQLRADMLQLPAAEGGAVVDIQLARQPAPRQGLLEGLHVRGQPLVQVKLRLRDEPAVVVDDGDQVGFSPLAVGEHLRAVHHIALPQVVDALGLELPAIGAHNGRVHQVLPVQQPVDRGGAERHRRTQKPAMLHLFDEVGDRRPRQLLAQLDQGECGLFIQPPTFTLVAAILRVE